MKKGLLAIVATLCISIGIISYYLFDTSQKLVSASPVAVVDEAVPDPVPEPEKKYGLVLDSLEVSEFKVKRNQTIAEIFGGFNISVAEVYNICNVSKPVYDLARINAGKSYKVYRSKDSTQKLQCFVYQASPLDRIVVKLTDSVEVFKEDIPVDTVVRSIGGMITSSLYETLTEQDASVDLPVALAGIFAWQVDFFRLFKGDNFKVIYEEISVNGTPIKTGKILAASFEQHGKTYYAYNFKEGDEEKYFNDEGRNVRGAFLKAPLKFFRITSRFTKKRYHPVLKRYKAHLGTDYAAPYGTPIQSVGSGTVVAARYSKYNGNYVKIKHNGTYTTQYLHMSKIAKGVRKGTRVKQGQTIGYVGSTGLATGPHVCYRFWRNGKQVDPRSVNVIESDPIKKENKVAFEKYRDEMKERLDKITFDEEPKEEVALK